MPGYNLIEAYITPSRFTRPQRAMQVKGLVIHWVANPGTTAKNNRDYFNNLPLNNQAKAVKLRSQGVSEQEIENQMVYASAHEIIGQGGEVVLAIPSNEMAYHVGSATYTPLGLSISSYPNDSLYGIEMCHMDWDGYMLQETYETAVLRCADLCKEFGLDPMTQIYLHKEIVGWKDCHMFFVKNPSQWQLFKEDVRHAMQPQEVLKMEQWMIDMGKQAIDSLHAKKLVANPEEWKPKLGEPVPTWLFWVMIDRLSNK